MRAHLLKTDSIEELARFWDDHDVTDFADELEEVPTSVFQRSAEAVSVPLSPAEREAIHRLATSRGLQEATLIHEWVKEKLRASLGEPGR